jgi:hypothetical protein
MTVDLEQILEPALKVMDILQEESVDYALGAIIGVTSQVAHRIRVDGEPIRPGRLHQFRLQINEVVDWALGEDVDGMSELTIGEMMDLLRKKLS